MTAVADMGTEMADWTTFRRAGDSGRLRIRIMGLCRRVRHARTGGRGRADRMAL